MEYLGDLGMFVYMKALAAYPAGDNGQAALKALTKCDRTSWCREIRDRDATMTRETPSPEGGSMSHGWGAATVAAVRLVLTIPESDLMITSSHGHIIS
jgi:hypothetical protein